MIAHAIFSTVTTILFVLLFQNNPPTPPSASAAVTRPSGYKQAMVSLVSEKYYVLLWVCFGILSGGYYAYLALIEQIGFPAGYTAVR